MPLRPTHLLLMLSLFGPSVPQDTSVPTTTSADFCSVTPLHCYRARCATELTIAAGFFDTSRAARERRLELWCTGSPLPVNIVRQARRSRRRSPWLRCANCPCTNAPFTSSVEPWASQSSACSPQRYKPYMGFLFVVSDVSTQAFSRPTLASQPLPSASGYNDLYEFISVLPQGTCTP